MNNRFGIWKKSNKVLINRLGHDTYYGPLREKTFGGLRTTKVQTSLHIRVVLSTPLLFYYWKVTYLDLLQVSVAEQAGLNLTLSETLKTGFVVSRPIYWQYQDIYEFINIGQQSAVFSKTLLNKLIWHIPTIPVDSETSWETVQILISWLLLKPADLDLHCFLKMIYQGKAGQGLNSHRYCPFIAPYHCRTLCGALCPSLSVLVMH